MKNDGKEAERAFLSYWETRGHVQRLRDRKDLIGLNKNARLVDFKKPADFLVSSKVEPLHYAEVKSCQGKRFPFASIQPGQAAAARLEATRGQGAFYFYIFSYDLGQWFVMSCNEFVSLVDQGHKSVALEELETWIK